MFKAKKHNFPRNYKSPKGLQNYLAAVQSDLMDPKNRNKVESNLKEEEKEALRVFINLQRDKQIVINPCDKGAGIIILDFDEYMRACMEHLEAKTVTGEKYYKKVGDNVMKEAKIIITNIVKEAYDNDIISKPEYSAMLPPEEEDPVPGRFYCTFKVHNNYEHGKAHPTRGLVSSSRTLLENIAIYVEHHINILGKSHETYLQDTPDILRHIDELNSKGELPKNAMIVVIDAVGLYDNIPPKEGVQFVGEGLKENPSSRVPERLLEIILEYSVFEFNQKKYQQRFGTNMGIKPAPSYANNFMSRSIDNKICEISETYSEIGEVPIRLLKRFLDDIFLIFLGTIVKLHQFFSYRNKSNSPTNKVYHGPHNTKNRKSGVSNLRL